VAKDPGQNHTPSSTQHANTTAASNAQAGAAAPKTGIQTVNAIAEAASNQAFLGVASAPVKPAGGDGFMKSDVNETRVIEWKSQARDGFAAQHAGDPGVSIEARTAAEQPETEEAATEETAAAEEKPTEAEAKADDAEKPADEKVEAKTEDKADEKKADEPEKKEELKPKIPKPTNGAATRRDAMRALKLEGDLRAANEEAARAKAALADRDTKLKTAPLEERLGLLGISIEDLREAAITGTLPEPKVPEKPAEVPPDVVAKLEAKIETIEKERAKERLESGQRETVALAMADMGAMEIPLVKNTAGAMHSVINEAATYYNQTGGKIDGNEVPFRDYVQSFALHKEAELKEAAPKVLEQLRGQASRIEQLLGLKAAEAGAGKPVDAEKVPANGAAAPRAPIGKKLAARPAVADDDKYSMDALQRDLEIKRELGWS
jgi:hypothetical protein